MSLKTKALNIILVTKAIEDSFTGIIDSFTKQIRMNNVFLTLAIEYVRGERIQMLNVD